VLHFAKDVIFKAVGLMAPSVCTDREREREREREHNSIGDRNDAEILYCYCRRNFLDLREGVDTQFSCRIPRNFEDPR